MSKTVSFLALTFAAAFASASFAQDTQPPRQGGQGGGYNRMSPEERAAAEVKTLKEKLALSDEQATKIEAIIKDRGKEMAAAREKNSDPEARRTASAEINKTFDAKIDAILTAEQKPKMEALREERRKQMEQRRPPSNPQ